MNLVVRMEFGSTVYGTRLPTSDTDYKAVYIPPMRDLLLGTQQETIQRKTKVDERAKNGADDIDEEIYSFKKYCDLLKQGQTVAVDMLFVPKQHWLEHDEWLWEKGLVHNRERFLHSGSASFVGYCRQQANKYGIKGSRVAAMRAFRDLLAEFTSHPDMRRLETYWPQLLELTHEHDPSLMSIEIGGIVNYFTCCGRKFGSTQRVAHALKQAQAIVAEYGARALQAEANDNIDWKALSHAVRIANQAVELLSTHHVTFPRPEAEQLLKIRKGELPYQQVAEMVETGIERVEAASAASTLPKTPDHAWIDDFVYSAYRK